MQVNQDSPDAPLPSSVYHLLRDPELFLGHMRCIVSPALFWVYPGVSYQLDVPGKPSVEGPQEQCWGNYFKGIALQTTNHAELQQSYLWAKSSMVS